MSEKRFEAEVLHTCVINELDENGEIINVLLVDELIKKVNEQQEIISKLTFEKGHLEAKNKRLKKQLQNLKDKIGF